MSGFILHASKRIKSLGRIRNLGGKLMALCSYHGILKGQEESGIVTQDLSSDSCVCCVIKLVPFKREGGHHTHTHKVSVCKTPSNTS